MPPKSKCRKSSGCGHRFRNEVMGREVDGTDAWKVFLQPPVPHRTCDTPQPALSSGGECASAAVYEWVSPAPSLIHDLRAELFNIRLQPLDKRLDLQVLDVLDCVTEFAHLLREYHDLTHGAVRPTGD